MRVKYLLKRIINGEFNNRIETVATHYKIDPRDLRIHVLLYLPRFSDRRQISIEEIHKEIDRVALMLYERINLVRAYILPPLKTVINLNSTYFREINECDAAIYFKHFHYIGYNRRNSRHFGLFLLDCNSTRVCASVTLSKFDLSHITLPDKVEPEEVRVISRVFAFNWAPHNSISFMLSQLNKIIRKESPKIVLLLTYVNPNIGFTGASYKASNFVLFGYENNTRYCYIDGIYITDRELQSRFGTIEEAELRKKLGDRFEICSDLSPLELYAFPLESRLREELLRKSPANFERPTK